MYSRSFIQVVGKPALRQNGFLHRRPPSPSSPICWNASSFHTCSPKRPPTNQLALLPKPYQTRSLRSSPVVHASPAPPHLKKRSRFLQFCFRAAAYFGTFVAVGTGLVVVFFVYDASTYSEDPTEVEIPVSELAMNPRRGGPKNLPILEHSIDDDQSEESRAQRDKPRLVLLGTGWGNVALLKKLVPDEYNVTIISPSNYFLFTPMLPSGTVGTLELRSLVEPIRRIVRRVKGHFLKASAEDIDFSNKLIECTAKSLDGQEQRFYIPYDKVVVGVGAVTNPHGVKGLENCHYLKDIDDVRAIRNRLVSNLEQACLPTTSDDERKRLLSFVVSGGGPTGVEFAAELFDMLNEDLNHYYPRLLRNEISVHVIQSRSHILNTYEEALSKYAEERFAHEHVDIITSSRVKEVQPDKILFTQKDESGNIVTKELPMGFCLWSTGVAQNPLCERIAAKLPVQNNRRALETDTHLRITGTPLGDVYAIGDASTVQNNSCDHILDFLRRLAVQRGQDPGQLRLTFSDWRKVAKSVRDKFPQAAGNLRRLDKLFEQHDKDQSGTLEFDELRDLLEQIDQKMTSLPATAQRAHQQGQYLAHKFNKLARSREGMAVNEVAYGDVDAALYRAFDYKHMGSLAYVGNAAVFDFGEGLGFSGGLMALYLWRSAYFAQSVSFRTRVLLAMDWGKRTLFGRDLMNF